MRYFLHVELAYDVAMRRYIPVNISFTSLTQEQHTRLIIKYCLAGVLSLGLVRNLFSSA